MFGNHDIKRQEWEISKMEVEGGGENKNMKSLYVTGREYNF
jgi:hypothetical protein